MFSLIIAIVSIALIVATVAATMYHGGDTLTQGRAKADAAAIVAGAQQVSGAAVMYLSLEGSAPANIAALQPNYLASVPTVGGLTLDTTPGNRQVIGTATSADVCVAINRSAGLDATAAKDVELTDIANLPFGCVTTGMAFSFKY